MRNLIPGDSENHDSASENQKGGQGPAIPWYWFRRWFGRKPAEEQVKPQKVHKLDAIQLEDRILYSASPLLAFLDPFAEHVQPVESDQTIQDLNDLLTEIIAASSEDATVIDRGSQSTNEVSSETRPVAQDELAEDSKESASGGEGVFDGNALNDDFPSALNAETSKLAPRHELIILQEGLFDLDAMIADITSQQSDERRFDILVLNRLEDGFEQLDTLLAQYDDLDAIHIVSHGSNGMMQLGGSWLTADNIQVFQSQLQSWEWRSTSRGISSSTVAM